VGVAPGGDVTMAIDEIAEHVTEECCAEAGDIAFYSEDRGYVEIGRPRAILLVDPIDGTRPARGRARIVLRVGRCCCRRRATRRSATSSSVSCTRSSSASGSRPAAVKARASNGADGTVVPVSRSDNTDLRALFWTAGLRGRPAVPVTILLEDLIDGSSMHGGYFDLGSATFNMTRIVTGQLDAYVDVGWRVLDELPELEAAFRVAGDGAVCTNFPYDVAASSLIVTEGGGVVTAADGGPLAPARRSVGRGYGVAVIASASAALHEQLLDAVTQG
jgi:myo-inositol-1(or 4)-monophosphatase